MTREIQFSAERIPVASDGGKASLTVNRRKLLLVGPKPPPIGGSPLTVQALLAEFMHYSELEITLINTSPGMDVRKKMTGFNLEKVRRSMTILPAFIHHISRTDAALVFSNDLFSITLVPLLRGIAWLFRKPFYLKPVAASLDMFISRLNPLLRRYLLFVLRSCNGVLPQTKVLAAELTNLGCRNVHYLPGCRPLQLNDVGKRQKDGIFRLIYLGHITRRKGILFLMQAMSQLANAGNGKIICDFYGPIHEEILEEFYEQLSLIPSVFYRGQVEPGSSIELIAGYDTLVLPTYFDTEGHPGVIIEAMQAGIPVISTRIRSLPELVTDGENGLLVPPQDASSLAQAIQALSSDQELTERMGAANKERGAEFTTEVVTANLINILFSGSRLTLTP
jgi:glycosyltransferase involved in cell wall biosynthesis